MAFAKMVSSGPEQAQRFVDDEDLANLQPIAFTAPGGRKTTKFIMLDEILEITNTDEKRKDLVAYMFNTRDKTFESGEYGAIITKADRDAFVSGRFHFRPHSSRGLALLH